MEGRMIIIIIIEFKLWPEKKIKFNVFQLCMFFRGEGKEESRKKNGKDLEGRIQMSNRFVADENKKKNIFLNKKFKIF